MSAIAIRPISSLEDVVHSYVRRGYQLLVVSALWSDVQSLAKRLSQPTNTKSTLMVSSLARLVYESSKSGEALFAQPTLIVLDEASFSEDATAWERVQHAARATDQDIVFVHVPAV